MDEPEFEYGGPERRAGRGRREEDLRWFGFERRISLGNLVTIATVVAGTLGTVFVWGGRAAQAYSDVRLWQQHVEDERKGDVEKQALRDDAIASRLSAIEDRLKVMDARLDARGR